MGKGGKRKSSPCKIPHLFSLLIYIEKYTFLIHAFHFNNEKNAEVIDVIILSLIGMKKGNKKGWILFINKGGKERRN